MSHSTDNVTAGSHQGNVAALGTTGPRREVGVTTAPRYGPGGTQTARGGRGDGTVLSILTASLCEQLPLHCPHPTCAPISAPLPLPLRRLLPPPGRLPRRSRCVRGGGVVRCHRGGKPESPTLPSPSVASGTRPASSAPPKPGQRLSPPSEGQGAPQCAGSASVPNLRPLIRMRRRADLCRESWE